MVWRGFELGVAITSGMSMIACESDAGRAVGEESER
jgi:hypothetical protein